MAIDRFLIAPLKSGLVTNTKSWQIMDDAFEYLQNAYIFRGRLRKRFGSQLMGPTEANPLTSRLRVSIGTTDGVTGNLGATNLPGGTPQLAIGQIFSVGTVIFTVTILGNVATLTTDPTITGAINSTANPNTFAIVGNGVTNLATAVYWYPSLPVMGITQYEIGAINNHPTYAFDTQFAYAFSSGWNRSGTAVWKGNDTNYFWADNWQGVTGDPVLFVTNFNFTVGAGTPAATDDPIWWLDGTTWTSLPGTVAGGGFFFLPGNSAVKTGPFVQTARIIIAFKNRLVLLNTVENNNVNGTGAGGVATQYVNRCRFSFNGSPFARNAWYEPNQMDSSGSVVNNNNIAAGAGYIDATTEEAIISAEFIKDRLIVYFERSTWELVYTQNEVLPFIWQKLNTELGSQSTFSTVPFDRDVLTIGNTGVHACNGSNVRRIDEKIPDKIFEFETRSGGTLRTAGIRDYFNELVYWAYVADFEQPFQKYPNQVLVYNYANDSWAVNDDCFMCFGYFEQATDETWASSAPITWENFDGDWVSNLFQANQRQMLGGTPEGFVLQIDSEQDRNAPSMSITDIEFNGTATLTLTIINHNLDPEPTEDTFDMDFILIENVVATTAAMAALNGTIFQVLSVTDANTITIATQPPLVLPNTEVYAGGGTAARVSNIQINSKNFNPYADQDNNVYVAKADFAVERTVAGAITVDYKTSYAPNLMLNDGGSLGTNTIMGNGILETSPYDPQLYPFETFQDLLWHPIYFQSSGEFIQFVMYFNLNQMLTNGVVLSPFQLQAICLYTQKVGRMQ